MPKAVYMIENLDCANCAAKIEAKINALPEVEEATITFATRQLRVTAADPEALIPQMLELARSIEPDAAIIPRTDTHGHHTHKECGCGHDHHAHDGCCKDPHHDCEGCCCVGHPHGNGDCSHDHQHGHAEKKTPGHDHAHGENESILPILAGAGLFAVGLILERFGLALPAAIAHVAAFLVLGFGVLKTAVKNLFRGHMLDENFLMSIATLGAFAIGEFAEAVGVMLFYRVGEYFEHKAVERSRSQIMEAVDLRPEVVTRLRDGAGEVIPAGDAQVGDILLVRPGDRIPLDGTVLTGESRIDTAPITGEPVPVYAGPGSSVTSGCVNTSGQLTMRVEKPLSESMVTRILDSVENAAASKPKIDRFITRFARVYTPVVVLVAAITAIVPSLVTGNWNYWVYTALSFLVMSCPCALVLSVPLAFFSGIGVGSKKGILFKGGVSIEALAGVNAAALDKTGTLTKGDFSVQQVTGSADTLALCASCEQYSTHPIAVSIVAAAKEQGLTLTKPDTLEELSGKGIRATVDGKAVLCGNRKLLEEAGIDLSTLPEDTSGTIVLVAAGGRLAGHIRIADTIKPEARGAIDKLRTLGVTTAMLTGDDTATAEAVAGALGLDEVHARLLPGEKLEKLQAIRAAHGKVMFVGDGINDAPVLSGADVGAAMDSGADAAIEAADVVFMTSSADAIPQSIAIARRTQRIAWQNVVFALAIKLIVMVLGLAGFASMWLAVFADSGVAMLCVLNSIRLLYSKK